ncbi:MarR family winged helix-turn-helix transcriptional regulator [Erythrobacter sp. HKB08]|uniref:MarR family winged helix-turn-helix transcriptional regulator n=1 Tax=Erythrobacter sp. HKB08 TaxID=2502843 RepID=UPI001008B83E|nr:MarR family winged helix-turn-helix transcriptional regulator [Erythrobacter sp. HKB08]
MSNSAAPEFVLADFLPYQLSVASNAVSNRIADVYRKEFGLKVTEWRVMAMLGDAGALTQRELTARTLMDKVAVNRACKVLAERELVRRQPNYRDGRSHLLELTEAGQDMHARIVPRARAIEEELLDALGEEQAGAFRSMLEEIRQKAG